MREWMKAVFAFVLVCASHAPARAASDDLVDVQAMIPKIVVELGYASPNNFTHEIIYPASARCYLRRDVAERLRAVQQRLEHDALGLKLYDCYRPPAAQQALWAKRPDPRYVADPAKGSRHARGAAVDITLVDRDGKELAMPTAWDDATERAGRSFRALAPEVLAHRARLDAELTKAGFIGLPSEWWHFDAADWQKDAPLDWDFSSLAPWPAASKQLVVVVANGWDAHEGRLVRYEREGTAWKQRGAAWPVALGKGLGWGVGVHAPAWATRFGGPVKREGDKRSPAGIFALGDATGYSSTPPVGTTLPYREATPRLYCVDDPTSSEYNRFALTPASGTPRWHSTEPMLRDDALYTRTIFVAHNRDPAPKAGLGSCIFLHVWSAPGHATIGCTAMPLPRVEELLSWLAASASPLLVQLPASVFHSLAPAWGLELE